MRLLRSQELSYRKKVIFWGILSYVLLLLMSYGFPVTGDDWYFYPKPGTSLSFGEQLRRAIVVSLQHYQTANGRLLGNFLVTFFLQKILRELFRCGVILFILLCVFRLSGNRSFASYLMCFALLVAMPARVVSQTYTWASGFFNYVPPVLLFFFYFGFAKQVVCDDLRRHSFGWIALLFLLGLSTQFFMENISVGMCALSAALFVTDLLRKKRIDWTLAAHLAGTVIGCIVMFLAPGYHNVGLEGYRNQASGLADLLLIAKNNFVQLSEYIITENYLVVISLCLSGMLVCVRANSETKGKRLISKACLLYYAAFPLLSYGIHYVGRYMFAIDFLIDLGLFVAIAFSAYSCIRDINARFVLFVAAGTFLVFMAPLLVVKPVGPRNAYFFDALLILIMMTLLRQATMDWDGIKQIASAMILASCLLLLGNMWIHFKNGSVERLRVQIAEEAMQRGDSVIELPGYPYPRYIHGDASIGAIGSFYYYSKCGDITFQFTPYKQWIQNH